MSKSTPPGRGITLYQLTVMIVVLAMLFALLLPALLKSRVAAGRSQSMSNLRQITLGIQTCAGEKSTGEIPPLWTQKEGEIPGGFRPASSFFCNLLPYIEQGNLYYALEKEKAESDLFRYEVRAYITSEDPSRNATEGLISYGANQMFFGKPSEKGARRYTGEGKWSGTDIAVPRITLMFTKGTNNLVLVSERYATTGESGKVVEHVWAKDNVGYEPSKEGGFELAPTVKDATDRLPQGFRSHAMLVGMADASVRIVNSGVSAKTWVWANDYLLKTEPPSDW